MTISSADPITRTAVGAYDQLAAAAASGTLTAARLDEILDVAEAAGVGSGPREPLDPELAGVAGALLGRMVPR